jgi:zinc protease
MKKELWLGVALALGIAWPARAAVYEPEMYTLANGLRVVVAVNRLSPAVKSMVWYRVGASDEGLGKTGLAHYLEHLMFRGTANVPPGAFSATVAAMGGADNAFTGYDETAYHETVAARDLGAVFVLEADRMRSLALVPETATPELAVVLSERDERTDNKPEGPFQEKMRAALYPACAYGRPVIGVKADIQGLTPDDARAFYRAHYAPNNAILVVTGNVTPATVVGLADATFGRLPPEAVPSRRPVACALEKTPKRVEVADSRVRQSVIEWQIRAPSLRENRRLSLALDVAGEILAGGQTGLLFDRLVRRDAVASNVDAEYDSLTRGPTSFGLIVTPRPGVAPETAEMALRQGLTDLARRGVRASEVQVAKKRLIRAATLSRDSLQAAGQALGSALVAGYDVGDVENWPEAIARITKADVDRALRALERMPHKVMGVLRPSGEALGEAAAVAPALGTEREIR